MERRWIGIGWTLALLALLGHVAGADCCLIRDAVRKSLDRVAAAPAAHACCAGAGAATVPAADEDAALPECCGVNCAPTATLEAAFALTAPASAPADMALESLDEPATPPSFRLALAPDLRGTPPEPASRVLRDRAPPIA